MTINENRQPRKIGFIGLGDMGKPMATNLLKAGNHLLVYDLKPERISALVSEGANGASSITEVVNGSDVVITMVRTPEDVEVAVLGKEGVADRGREGILVIDFTTVGPQVSLRIADRLQKKGIQYIEAAVSGVPIRAQAGELTIALSGDEKLIQENMDIFQAVGKQIFLVGPYGNAKKIKIANNTLTAINQMAIYEVSTMLRKAGVDIEMFSKILRECSGYSKAAERLSIVKSREFDRTGGTGRLSLLHKDLGLSLELGDGVEAAMPFAALAHQLSQISRAAGISEEGSTSLVKIFEKLSHLEDSTGT